MSGVEFTEHALRRMHQRGILREQVEHLIAHPENRFQGYAGRTVCQSIVRGPAEGLTSCGPWWTTHRIPLPL